MAKSLKQKAKAQASGANWRDSAPPATADGSSAPPIKANNPPQYKAAYSGKDFGMGKMRHMGR